MRISILLLALSTFSTLDGETKLKRAISDVHSKQKSKASNIVEGSGSPVGGKKPGTVSTDLEWDGSGLGPDDEDGDVDEGSGNANNDVVEGSAHRAKPSPTPVIVASTAPSSTIKDVVIDEDEKPDEEVVHTVPTRPVLLTTSTTTTTQRPLFTRPSPNIYDFDDHRTPLDVLPAPGMLAAYIGGGVVGVLFVVTLIMFLIYRMRKKDEGSYALDEPKQPPHYSYAYQKAPTKEFYA